ncbi:ATP-dependent DNA helicase PIF1 [Linum grandiflorum]
MIHRQSFEAVDRTLCDIMNTPAFGPSYKAFTNMRIQGSELNSLNIFEGVPFRDWVLAAGDGKLTTTEPHDGLYSDSIHLPSCFVLPPSENQIAYLVARLYPFLQSSHHSVRYIWSRAIIAPTNIVVSEISSFILSKLPGEVKIYLSSDSLTTPSPDQASLELEYPLEFLNGLSFNGIPKHQLQLKQYVIVMLFRNLNPAAGLCNGTRILITHLGTNVVRGLIIGGSYEGTVAIIPRIVLDYTDPNGPFTLKRQQYPLHVCYAMTIYKSQGQTL